MSTMQQPCTCAARAQLRQIEGADVDALAPPCTHHPEPITEACRCPANYSARQGTRYAGDLPCPVHPEGMPYDPASPARYARLANGEIHDAHAPGRFWVIRNGRVAGNYVRSQADGSAKDESARHPRHTVQIVAADTGELVAQWRKGQQAALPWGE